jgi:hypothetical protein
MTDDEEDKEMVKEFLRRQSLVIKKQRQSQRIQVRTKIAMIAKEQIQDPKTFAEAMQSVQKKESIDAMQRELDSLHELNTFQWVEIPAELEKQEIL